MLLGMVLQVRQELEGWPHRYSVLAKLTWPRLSRRSQSEIVRQAREFQPGELDSRLTKGYENGSTCDSRLLST